MATPARTPRVSQVWVEIPPSPLHESQRRMAIDVRKVNTPFSPRYIDHNIQPTSHASSSVSKDVSSDASTARKRKLSESSEKIMKHDQKTKKPKPAATSQDDLVYCHQCARKVEPSSTIACTFNGNKGNRCRVKYCIACVKNRYEKDGDAIKAAGIPSDPNARDGHVPDGDYIFRCPRCDNICNCRRCRKVKGLPALGKFTGPGASQPTNGQSAQANAGPSTVSTSKPKPKPKSAVKARTATTSTSTSKSKPATAKPKPKPRAPKPVPQPTWRAVPTDLDRADAEARIQLREFVLRFAALMELSKRSLEDLDDFDALSDTTTRAVLIQLLGLIAADAGVDEKKHIMDAMKEIRGSGTNFSKIWTALGSLRSLVPAETLSFPDPTPAASAAPGTAHPATRQGGIQIVGAQLIPVLVGLVDEALRRPSVREELDNGVKDGREANRVLWAALREENNRWNEEKKELNEEKGVEEEKQGQAWDAEALKANYKVRYDEHKATIAELEWDHAEMVHLYAQRFRALGTDLDGRVYYALSPPFAKKVLSYDERKSLKKWPWCLAVWGKLPDGAPRIRGEENDEDESEDEDEQDEEDAERWWGFCEPKEVQKLAKWISARSDLKPSKTGSLSTSSSGTAARPKNDEEEVDISSRASSPLLEADDGSDEGRNVDLGGPTTKGQLKALVKGLTDFAETLTSRIGVEEENEGEKDTVSATKGAIATSKFYTK